MCAYGSSILRRHELRPPRTLSEDSMKKRRFAALALLAPLASLALLTGCGGLTPLSLSANWYANTADGKNLSDTYEELEYDVTFAPRGGDYTVDYTLGSYKTTLATESYQLSSEISTPVYHYHTEYSISGHFSYKGVPGLPFDDTATSDVWFMSLDDGFYPIKSEREVHATVPVNNPKVGRFSERYDYKYTLEYDAGLKTEPKKAQYTLYYFEKDGENEEATVAKVDFEKSLKLSGSGTYLDNEQIFFALRGLDMNEKVTFRSIDPQTLLTSKIAFSEKPSSEKDTVNFTRTVGDKTDTVSTQIETMHVNIAYSTAQPGPTRTLVYAKKTSADNNVYRNVLLKIENPIAHSLGIMTYTLKSAKFSHR